jgi:hypothetical protein
LLFAQNTQAFDWISEAYVSETQRYTDNLRLQLQPKRTNLITTLSPAAILGYLSDSNELRVRLNWNQLIYDDENSLDFSEKIATLTDAYHNEKWTTNLSARYGYESSLASQLDVNGSGNLTTQVARQSETITPDIIYALSPKNSLELTGTYSKVNFASHPSNGFYDYTNNSINGIFTHQYTETLSFNLNTGYTVYDAGDTTLNGFYFGNSNAPKYYTYKQNSKTLSYQLGFNYRYDEKTTITGSGGLRNSDTGSNISNYAQNVNCAVNSSIYCPNSAETVSSTTNGKLYSASIKRDLENGFVNLSYNQQLNPASTGNQQQTQQVSANFNFDISDRWNTSLNYTYLISDYIAGFNNTNNSTAYINLNNRTLNMITPNLKWKWTPEMYFQLSYTYMDQLYTLTNQNAVGNNMQIQFVYQPQTNRQVK